MKIPEAERNAIAEEINRRAAESHDEKTIREKYERVVLIALGRFQLLEFALKKYIEKWASMPANSKIKDEITNNLEDLPLGVLLKRLKRIDPHEKLIDEIADLTSFRNEIAHQALLEISGASTIDVVKHFNAAPYYAYKVMEVEHCLKGILNKYKSLQVGT